MIHTLKIDDSFPSGKRLLEELQQLPDAVEFEFPVVTGVAPEGYMTGEDFWKAVKSDLKELYLEHGFL